MASSINKLLSGKKKEATNVLDLDIKSKKNFSKSKSDAMNKKTHIVNPEDVIPLEDDAGGF